MKQNTVNNNNNQDHDLLISVHEQVKQIHLDIKGLTEGTTAKITDHEERLRKLEQKLWLWAGGLVVLTFLIPLAVNALTRYLSK